MSLSMHLREATRVIAELGGHGDSKLPADEFDQDDLGKRINSAAAILCDWVSSSSVWDDIHDEDLADWNREHRLPAIARMIAYGMAAQFEHDLKFL